jgi:subtilase family serine protease
MRTFRSSLCLILASALLTAVCFAEAPDRIAATIDSSRMVALKGQVHGLARSAFDQGRADAGKLMSGVSLSFRPSPAQQSALDELLAEQQDHSSPNYHRWLTPAQFADRFGLSHNDVAKVVAWLESQGFQVTRVANSRNQIFFQGTVAQIEAAFHTEIHNYLVNEEMHWGNATEPSVPAALSGMAIGLTNLHSFQPRPRMRRRTGSQGVARPDFTSFVSGNHYLTPGDFATIYAVKALYAAGITGTGQAVAIVGQSTVNSTDLSNFRTAAGLSANAPTMVLVPSTGVGTRCSGDEGESDLDLEWSGGVAQDATIVFVFVGLVSGDTCTNRSFSAFDSIGYAVDQNLAPVISSSYGNCEANLGSFSSTLQGWAQQGNTQGQTLVSATGDSGAADCDPNATDPNDTSATGGLAVDLPAGIPEVTGAGGTELVGTTSVPDVPATVTGTPPDTTASATAYWSGTPAGSDAISSALKYIPETGWNDSAFDIAHGGGMASSGGGKSIDFTKPTWQKGTGVPADGQRDVPDISLSASANQDAYLICSEDDGAGGIQTTCTSGFRDGAGGGLDPIGGTSAAAPTFAAVVALVNQYLGNAAPAGLGNINPSLYPLLGTTAFNDVTTGNNIVPCKTGSTNCPALPAAQQFGFSAGVGYDQVTGLGSPNAFALAKALAAAATASSIALVPSATSISQGGSVTLTATVSPATATGTVSFYANYSSGSTKPLALPVAPNGSGVATLTTTALPVGADNVTATFDGTGVFGSANSAVSVITVTSTAPKTFTLAQGTASLQVNPGQQGTATINVTPQNGFNSALTFSCTETTALSASGSTCTMAPSTPTTAASVTLTVTTIAPTAQLRPPLAGGKAIFYAALLPGLLGIVFTAGSRKRAARGVRFLSMILVLGFSTLWLGACSSNSRSTGNPGTPAGSYVLTVNATTGGANPVTGSTIVTLVVQ